MRIFIFFCLAVTFLAASSTHAAERQKWRQDAQRTAHENGYDLVDDKGLSLLGAAGKDFILIDARPLYEYSAGHIAGAVSFEFDLSNSVSQQRLQAFEKLVGKRKDNPIVFYCRSIR